MNLISHPVLTMPKALKWILGLAAAGILLATAAFAVVVEKIDAPPRSLARYVMQRALGHNEVITSTAGSLADWLVEQDRSTGIDKAPAFASIGAKPRAYPATNHAMEVSVSTSSEVLAAISNAKPGQIITLAPGRYRFGGRPIAAAAAGSETQRIVVRAERLGTVLIQFDMPEGFSVSAPYWTFENLTIQGICVAHDNCEHAFHVVGGAHHFVARNNVVSDFNAHFKINGLKGEMPDFGTIEHNTLSNTTVRRTGRPVTPIDLVAASGWTIHHNLIRDFVKGKGDQISYGAFVKGGGSNNRLEQNVVLCEVAQKGAPGQRVGLSLGGGGTGREFCRDRRCIVEQERSVIQSNLIAFCSDDGIYINRAAASKVVHNTLIDTAGIKVRYPESTADVAGNVVDGIIRAVDDGLIRDGGNRHTSLWNLYLGRHPERAVYLSADSLNLIWANVPERRESQDAVPDLCQANRPKTPTYGAFEDFAACF